jgi:hypothetical protein
MQAQSTQAELNQIELMKQFLGTYQANTGKDTIEIWESQLYGNGIIISVSQVIKGKKNPIYVNNTGLNSEEGKLMGFILNTNATYTTWIGQFSDDKNFGGVLMNNFKPEQAWGKFSFVFINPKEWTFAVYDMNGVKTSDWKFVKVK